MNPATCSDVTCHKNARWSIDKSMPGDLGVAIYNYCDEHQKEMSLAWPDDILKWNPIPLTLDEQLNMIGEEVTHPSIAEMPFFGWDKDVVIKALWAGYQQEKRRGNGELIIQRHLLEALEEQAVLVQMGGNVSNELRRIQPIVKKLTEMYNEVQNP